MPSTLWGANKSAELAPAGHKSPIVIIPVGSTEQHGPHLPVQVDTILVTEIARRSAELVAAAEPVHVLPTLWVSLAEHHMAFPGTLTLDFATFQQVLRCLVRSLKRQGFGRVLILNGHGGNSLPLAVIVNELAHEFGLRVAAATYWMAAAASFADILEAQPNVRHACEAETAMMLALQPELVDMDAARALECPADGFGEDGGMQQYRAFAEWTPTGVIGVPALANAEKGERLLNAAATAIAARLTDGSLWHPMG